MKSYVPIIILLLNIVLLCGSCDKWPNDPPLDGMWQLTQVCRDGDVEDVTGQQSYWSFRRGICQLTSITHKGCYAHYTHTPDSLSFYDFVSASEYVTGNDNNPWMTMADSLLLSVAWGMDVEADREHPGRLCASYRIDVLNAGTLVLGRGTLRLVFRKF